MKPPPKTLVNHIVLHEFLKRYYGQYILGALLLIGSSSLQVAIPKLIGVIIDQMKTGAAAPSILAW